MNDDVGTTGKTIKQNAFLDNQSRRTFLKGIAAVTAGTACAASGLARDDFYGPRTETQARFYTKLEKKAVQCHQCFRHCVIGKGKTGYCDVRINRSGKLMTMSYGNPGAINVDPIEKKPLNHFLPGSKAFSLAEIGCNIDCKFCQNWQIAQTKPGRLQTRSMSPGKAVSEAIASGSKSIAFTYSEPTVWSEYVLDCAEEARKQGIQSVVISNGTWSQQVLDQIQNVVSAVKIDLKSIRPAFYRDVCHGELAPVLRNIEHLRKAGIWLELVNLVIPTLNDSEAEINEMTRWMMNTIGSDVPLHFTRFHPMYKLKSLPPTPIPTLDRCRKIARASGLKYVYVGNVPSSAGCHTYCPTCGQLLIERSGYHVVIKNFSNGKCSKCQTPVPGIWSV